MNIPVIFSSIAPVGIGKYREFNLHKYDTYRLIHGLFHIALVISQRP